MGWPSSRPDYDVEDSFTLWDLTPSEKEAMLKLYSQLPDDKRPKKTDNFMDINYGKDQDFEAYAKEFEKSIEVIDWSIL